MNLSYTRYLKEILGALRVLRIWASAEDGGADADFCGAFLDGDFEIVGHAHGEDREWEAGRAGEIVSQFAQALEIGADFFWVFQERRDAHQAGDFEVFKLSELFEQFRDGVEFGAGFGGLVFDADFDEDAEFFFGI